MTILIKQKWVNKIKKTKYRLTPAGVKELKLRMNTDKAGSYQIAAYGVITGDDLLARLS
jgi:DNA-binding PadR family transcriptional regulator